MPPDPTVTRSIVIPEGIITAHDNGHLRGWIRGNPLVQVRMASPATVMLALKGPQDQNWRILIGTLAGCIEMRSLPNLNLIRVWKVHKSPVTALTAPHEQRDRMRIISADASGTVFASGDDFVRGSMELFSVGQRITSIRCDAETISISCGWERMEMDWLGCPLRREAVRNLATGNRHRQTLLAI